MTAMRRAAPTLALVLLLAAPASTASAAQIQENPLDEARRTAQQQRQHFEAHVRVEWPGHRAELDVVSAQGMTQVVGPDNETLIAGADERFLLDDAGWSLLWPGGSSQMEGAPLSPKYQVATAPGGVVAGRPTTDVVVREYGALVERMAVDLSTGLVLRRELFDDAGRRVRLVEVERLVLGQSTTVPSTPVHKTRRESTRRLKAEAVSAPFDAPTRLDGDYLQVGAFRRGDVVHMLYSDGLHALSVFAQAGKLSTGALPAGGNRTLIGKGKGWRYAWPGGDVLTWEAGGVVFTAVGDAPVADVLAAAASMPWGRRPGLTDRIRRTCRALVETVTGG